MPRPDVTLVSAYPPPGDLHGGSSGVASYTANLARSLADLGLDVAVVAPHESPDDPAVHTDGPVRVHRSGPRGGRALGDAVRVAAQLDGGITHVQHEWFLWGGPASIPDTFRGLRHLRTRTTRPTVATMHQVVRRGAVDRAFTDVHDLPAAPQMIGPAFQGLQRSLAAQVDQVIVHEPAFREALPDARVVPHGLEPGSPLSRQQARRSLGLPEGGEQFVVLNFGFVAPYKGLDVALGGVEAAGPDVLGVVAGGPHPRHGEAMLRHLQARFEHTARFTGFVPDEDVTTWFRASDVTLMLYPRPHASSGVLALALANDCPALLSPGLAEATGAPASMTVDQDPIALARRLRLLADDPGERPRLRTDGRRMAAGRDWHTIARAHARIYEETLHAHRTAGRSLRARKPGGRGTAGGVRRRARRMAAARDLS